MKFPLSWLKDYVDITLSPEDLAEMLTMAGLEVESLEYVGSAIDNIITGKIEHITPHPNADKLVITSVFDGTTHHSIVTGASNVNVGDIVPVALPGSTIATGMTLKAAKLRGVDSFGMLCSEKELGVPESIDGLWILPPDTPLGVDVAEYAFLKDVIFDIAILPNRGDCQSIYGLAREIAVLTQSTLKPIESTVSFKSIPHHFTLTVNQPELCPFYVGRYVSAIKAIESPLFIKRRLELAGLRSISFIVDVTNYVLLELGQPMHAFDTDKLKTTDFVVDITSSAIDLETLDSTTRSVAESTLLIYNESPVAIAGVMGAASTDVNNKTTNIFLESAFFDAKHVRKSSTKLGLRTESSIRFEKGIYIDFVETASLRACHLLQKYAQATIAEHPVMFKHEQDYRFKPATLSFDGAQINSCLGSQFEDTQMMSVLEQLGFVFNSNKDAVTVPLWRLADISDWPCLAEEIARIIGFDSIASTLPESFCIQDKPHMQDNVISTIQSFFTHHGFVETCTYPMISEQDFKLSSQSEASLKQTLSNPITPQLAYMRASMLPSLIQLISYHHSRQMSDLALFEIGKTFSDQGEESLMLSAVLTGHIFQHHYSQNKQSADTILSYLKGLLEHCIDTFDLSLEFKSENNPSWAHPTQWINIFKDKHCVGQLCLLHPTYLKNYNITADVGYFELNLSTILTKQLKKPTYTPFSRYPSIRRDVAIVADKSLQYCDIETVIKTNKHKTMQDFFLFDYFESDQLGKDKKSMAIAFIYQDINDTLSDEHVSKQHTKLCDKLVKQLNVSIR